MRPFRQDDLQAFIEVREVLELKALELARPKLDAGEVVICDRFADSTRVYQGATRGDLRATVDGLHDLMIAKEPDLTIILDMDPDVALERGLARDSGEDRFEEFGADFQRRLRQGFLDPAKEFPSRCAVVDATRGPDAIAADILGLVAARLG